LRISQNGQEPNTLPDPALWPCLGPREGLRARLKQGRYQDITMMGYFSSFYVNITH